MLNNFIRTTKPFFAAFGALGIAGSIFVGIAYAAPTVIFQKSILPEVTDRYDLGSSTPALEWNGLYVKTVCLSGDCKSAWPSGSGGGSWPFTPSTNYGVAVQATTTPEWFQNGLMASSTSYFVNASTSLMTVGANTFIQSSATSTFGAGISGTYLNLSGPSATSTAANGFDLSAGCFSIAGTCLQTIVSSASAYKQAVSYASTSTLPSNTYNNGTAGVGATLTGVANGPFYIDGNTPTVGDRVLVKNEAAGANNGIYTLTTLGIVAVSPFVLTRATDYNSSADVFPGVANFVNGGTVNANTCWILTNTSAVTIGTTALTYADECGAGSFLATYPLVITGTTFSFSGVSTSSIPTIGNLAYWTGANTLGTVATGTVSAGSSAITVTAGRSAIGGALAIDCTTATGSQNGCISSNDWTTFNGKLNLTNLFTTGFLTYATTTLATSTPIKLLNFYASSTAANPSVIDNFSFSNATGTAATTTNFAITSVTSALLLSNATGGLIKYGGASACSANNFVTTLSAVGGTTCGNSTVGATSPNSTLSFGAAAAFGATFTGDINLGTSNQWTASTTMTKVLNLQNASSSLNTFGTTWIPSITSAILSTDSAGKLQTTTLGTGFSYSTPTLSNVVEKSFTYSTTTWTGTTTIPLFQATIAATINSFSCKTFLAGNTPGGTLNIQLGKWTASTTMMNASSTNNINALAANNTTAARDSWFVDVGTPASSPVTINCTYKLTY